jgi:hypothetical protein
MFKYDMFSKQYYLFNYHCMRYKFGLWTLRPNFSHQGSSYIPETVVNINRKTAVHLKQRVEQTTIVLGFNELSDTYITYSF